ncbi:MAG TPA: hypothetical protein VFT72_06310 [Opitutaceae bacterium]|nr:hypothetical protein [Opitutaceae bacterium]
MRWVFAELRRLADVGLWERWRPRRHSYLSSPPQGADGLNGHVFRGKSSPRLALR